MISVSELLDWVATLPLNHNVAIDEGGLTLVEVDLELKTTEAYLEVGGEPENEMPWCDACRSYHVVPGDKLHHTLLKCRAPWKGDS